MLAKLARSKTLGADRNLNFRVMAVDSCRYFQQPDWLSNGWKLLTHVDCVRDYLMPTPSSNYRICKKAELRYDTGVCNATHRFLCVLSAGGARLLEFDVTHDWTPLSGRSCIPSRTVGLV